MKCIAVIDSSVQTSRGAPPRELVDVAVVILPRGHDRGHASAACDVAGTVSRW